MNFTAKLHIQGVGCYVPLHETEDKQVAEGAAKRLLVVFPDGREGPVCIHLNFVQFLGRYVNPNLSGYLTQFLDKELLTIDTGNNTPECRVSLGHLPSMAEALPLPNEAPFRPVDEKIIKNQSSAGVVGKLLVSEGTVGGYKKGNETPYTFKWYFHGNENNAREMTSVTTVTYTNINQFNLKFSKLGPAGGERPPLTLSPHGNGDLEVWVRNMCDGFPPDVKEDHEGPPEPFVAEDKDFVLNYKLRNLPANHRTPVPKVKGQVGGEAHKCLGSH